VKTFVSGVSHGDFYEMIYHNGEFMQGIAGVWSATLFQPLEKQIDKRAQRYWRDTITHTWPATSADRAAFGPAWTAYHDYLMHPEKSDPYWHSPTYDAIRDSYKGVQVPVMITERWYDFFLPGTLRTFESLRRAIRALWSSSPATTAPTPAISRYSQERQSLLGYAGVVRPFPERHAFSRQFAAGLHDLCQRRGPLGAPGILAPRRRNLLTLNPARLACYRTVAVAAASLREARANEQPVSYVYDPRNPVPTRGGSDMVVDGLAPSSSAEQKNDLCRRPDVLSFASASSKRRL